MCFRLEILHFKLMLSLKSFEPNQICYVFNFMKKLKCLKRGHIYYFQDFLKTDKITLLSIPNNSILFYASFRRMSLLCYPMHLSCISFALFVRRLPHIKKRLFYESVSQKRVMIDSVEM